MRLSLHLVAWVALFTAAGTAAQSSGVSSQVRALEPGSYVHGLEVDGAPGPAFSGSNARRATLRDLAYAAPRLAPTEIHRLGPLTDGERKALSSALISGERFKVGIARALPQPVGFDLSTRRTLPGSGDRIGGGLLVHRGGQLVWTAGFISPGAGAVRLRLDGVSLPIGTVAYVYNIEGEAHGPYAIGGFQPDSIWTNTLFSNEAFVEIQFPKELVDVSTAKLSVSAIGHLQHESFFPSGLAKKSAESLANCFADASCVDEGELVGVGNASKAVARMLFESEGSMFVCSGALVNTTAGTAIPYFITANHCIGSAVSAKSLELFWDYKTVSCGGSTPNSGGIPRTLGASVLATGSVEQGEADFTLLQLSQEPPAGRFYLGWTTASEALGGGTKIYRLSHPEGGTQMFSRHAISAVPTPGECPNLPQSRFVYSKNELGATKGGSSGAPAFVEDGLKIVGQLYGRCGSNLTDSCDATENSAVDGALSSYFPRVSRWLAPATTSPCSPSAENLCLLGSRFKVELTGLDPRTGKVGSGMAIAESDLFGYFSLPSLTGQADNPEVFVKVLDGRAVSGKFWVFYGGLTDLEFTLTVTDSVTGVMKSYSRAGGSFCGNADTQAF